MEVIEAIEGVNYFPDKEVRHDKCKNICKGWLGLLDLTYDPVKCVERRKERAKETPYHNYSSEEATEPDIPYGQQLADGFGMINGFEQ